MDGVSGTWWGGGVTYCPPHLHSSAVGNSVNGLARFSYFEVTAGRSSLLN
jgi:hypothetical protein